MLQLCRASKRAKFKTAKELIQHREPTDSCRGQKNTQNMTTGNDNPLTPHNKRSLLAVVHLLKSSAQFTAGNHVPTVAAAVTTGNTAVS